MMWKTQHRAISQPNARSAVGWNVSYAAFGIAGVGAALVMDVLVGTGTSNTFNLIAGPALFGAMALLLVASGSTRIEASSEQVKAVDLFQQQVVSATDIQRIDTKNGLRFVLGSGRTVGSWAFGPSLLALMLGNRRAKRFARRLEPVLPEAFAGSEAGWHSDNAQSAVRVFFYGWGALFVVFNIALAVLVRLG